MLYELIGQTLTLWFQAKPADKAISPSYVLKSCGGSATSLMLYETVNTHVLMQNIWKEFS